MNTFKKYGYVWIALVLFLGSLAGHWRLTKKNRVHNQPVVFSEYAIEVGRDTLENWQSEFLQLIWQVAGLAFLLYIGSPTSKEGDERKEEKLDEILKLLDKEKARQIISQLEKKYPKK